MVYYLKNREDAIVDSPDHKIPVTQVGEMYANAKFHNFSEISLDISEQKEKKF